VTPPQDAPPYHDDLDATLAEAWRLLREGVDDAGSAFHTPAVATVTADGLPAVRTVILRGADPAARVLRFYTDGRAAKVAEIAARPRIVLHVYQPGPEIQLRLDCLATVHGHDAPADAAWQAVPQGGRDNYRADPAPATPIPDPHAAGLLPADENPDAGRAFFRVVEAQVLALEWLLLAKAGQRRARFSWPEGRLEGTWLVP